MSCPVGSTGVRKGWAEQALKTFSVFCLELPGLCFLEFFVFVFGCPAAYGVSSQGSDLRCSCDLSRSCVNAGSLIHCAWAGFEPGSQHSQEATDHIAPQRELLSTPLIYVSGASPEGLVKNPDCGHPPTVSFSKSRVGPENVHF